MAITFSFKSIARKLLGAKYPLYCDLYWMWRTRRKIYANRAARESLKQMAKFKDRHKGQRCVIIGNGPSLNKMDLGFLKNEITFGANRIYLLTEKSEFSLSYYLSANLLVMKQFAEDIRKISCPKFLSANGCEFFSRDDENLMFFASLPGWGFAKDIRGGLWEGQTVTFCAMQVAYYMGFSEVVLVGVDHSFATTGQANEEIVMDHDDGANHFDPNYFPKGVRWNLPDLENSETAYRIARDVYQQDGRRILDATVDGNLSVFPKVDYKEHFGIE